MTTIYAVSEKTFFVRKPESRQERRNQQPNQRARLPESGVKKRRKPLHGCLGTAVKSKAFSSAVIYAKAEQFAIILFENENLAVKDNFYPVR